MRLTQAERAEEQKLQAEREEEYARREEQMLTELLGETVKVRNRGYKTMKQAVIEAKPRTKWQDNELVEDGFMVVLSWKDDEGRSGSVRLLRRLDVMTKDGWATVWDDGMSDLPEWDRSRPATSAKATGLKYKAGML